MIEQQKTPASAKREFLNALFYFIATTASKSSQIFASGALVSREKITIKIQEDNIEVSIS